MHYKNTLASTYGSSSYNSSDYNGSTATSSTGSGGSSSAGGSLANTGLAVGFVVALAATILLVAMVVRVWKRGQKPAISE